MDDVTQPTLPGIDLSLDAAIQEAIEALRMFQRREGEYYECFSGGKDSLVVSRLVRMAGVKSSRFHNLTTIDPPELVHYLKAEHGDVTILRPEKPYFARCKEKAFMPTRRARWCCAEYKERPGPVGSLMLMGVRKQESPKRLANWGLVTTHLRAKCRVLSPIIHWTEKHVWKFIRQERLSYCSLYDEGFTRIGCIGCPLNPEAREREFARYPGFSREWRKCAFATWERRHGCTQRDGREWFADRFCASADDFWEWWLAGARIPDMPPEDEEQCQGLLEGFA